MREIVFRGKRLDNGEWIYGAFMPGNVCHKCQIVTSWIGEDEQHRHWVKAFPVDEDTAGQYTGLKDKNGQRIFEGDILQFTNDDGEKSLYICEWAQHGWYTRPFEDYLLGDYLDEFFCHYSIVIGNIHDNPELLNNTEVDT